MRLILRCLFFVLHVFFFESAKFRKISIYIECYMLIAMSDRFFSRDVFAKLGASFDANTSAIGSW